jgi:hypothetical protein
MTKDERDTNAIARARIWADVCLGGKGFAVFVIFLFASVRLGLERGEGASRI